MRSPRTFLLLLPILLMAVAWGCARRESTETSMSADSLVDSTGLAPADHVDQMPLAESVDSGGVRDVPADSATQVVAPAAEVETLRGQIRTASNALDAAVRSADYAAIDRQALVLRDLVTAIAGKAATAMRGEDRAKLEQAMHGVSETAEKVRVHAQGRSIAGVRAEHQTLKNLVTQIIQLTGGRPT